MDSLILERFQAQRLYTKAVSNKNHMTKSTRKEDIHSAWLQQLMGKIAATIQSRAADAVCT
jgi:hypothetical protein